MIVTLIALVMGGYSSSFSQKPYRVGTTAADFLAIGYGAAGSAMGEASVSVVHDLSSVYWNPAGIAYMEQNEALFTYQPWIADIQTSVIALGMSFPRIGTVALSLIQVDYGDMEVTNLDMQDGTGELFTASDLAFGLSYGRRLAQWFAFGASGKFVSSKIWHTSASAVAIDLGVVVNTHFLSPTGDRKDGINIGMSISNYGTKMKYDGLDLLFPIDILPDKEGNYRDVEGKFSLQSWELPLIFRIGLSFNPVIVGPHRLTVAVDALHPNNNAESVNIGAQYQLKLPSYGEFYLRAGQKALFLGDDSEYGMSFGGGMVLRMMNNMGLRFSYAFRNVGLFGNYHEYTVGLIF
ncbi:PorV/PorQ family protein [candidate division KSB1 bacterium]|nr:PorV/PorQ family protein [candidate division KSB1 bacterium]